MKFSIHGPVDLPRAKGLIDSSAVAKKTLWQRVSELDPELPSACGCYIFVVKARRGTLPWYIGLTKRTFKAEALGAHQINHYNLALAEKTGVAPQLFFLAKETPTGKFAKPSRDAHKDVEFLETLLFGIALNRNPALRNTKNTKFLKNVCVPAIINSPARKPNKQELALKAALGL